MLEYYYIPVEGEVKKMEKDDAVKLMYEISQQWEDEKHPFGTLKVGVYDWAYTDHKNGRIELHIPRLSTGGSIPVNEKISNLIKDKTYGDCFIVVDEKDKSKIESLINP